MFGQINKSPNDHARLSGSFLDPLKVQGSAAALLVKEQQLIVLAINHCIMIIENNCRQVLCLHIQPWWSFVGCCCYDNSLLQQSHISKLLYSCSPFTAVNTLLTNNKIVNRNLKMLEGELK